MHEIIKPGLVLLIITAVAAAGLGFTYNVTKTPIAEQQAKATAEAMQKVLPEADKFEEDINVPEESPVESAATGYKGGDPAGYVIGVAPKGYDGPIEMLVGIGTDGVITGISIVSMTETPGLGANAKEEKFTDLYKGKSGQLTVTKSASPGDNEIQAMTSATITTNAVTLGVNQALEFYDAEIASGKEGS